MFGHDLSRRRHIVKTSTAVIVGQQDGVPLRLTCEIQIVTYGFQCSLVTFFAEGLGGSFAWRGMLNGDKLYKRITDEVVGAYCVDGIE